MYDTTHNISFIPIDEGFTKKITAIACDNFADIEDDYCLGNKSFPHVTLCHLVLKSDEEIEKIKELVKKIDQFPSTLKLQAIYFLPSNSRPNSVDTCYLVKKTKEIEAFQLSIVEKVKDIGVSVGSGTEENYLPHFTMARIHLNDAYCIKASAHLLLGMDVPVKVVFGRSDKENQFVGTL